MIDPDRFLSFRNGQGSAQCGPATFYFSRGKPPRLPGMRFIEIEYFPKRKSRMLSEDDPDHWRDMSEVECLIADKVLFQMLADEMARWS